MKTRSYVEFQYKSEFRDGLRNKFRMGNSYFSLNFGILYREFYYCKANNFLQEEKRGLVGL